jgi:hypothetical protein
MRNLKIILLVTLSILSGQMSKGQIIPKNPLDPADPNAIDTSTWKGANGAVYLNTSSKKVGIGTTAPTSKLHVAGDVFIPTAYSYSIGSATDAGNRLRMRYLNSNAYIDFAPNLYFRTGTTPFVSFTSTKKVGIGTTNPEARLQINGEGDPMLIEAGIRGDTMHSLQLWGTDQALFMGVSTKRRVSYLQSCDIWTAANTIALNPQGGSVTIGTIYSPDNCKLAVNGRVICESIKVIANVPDADYVFDSEYNLMNINTLEYYIKEHKHLPNIPSAEEFKINGYQLGDMDEMLLRKVEELTLYLIEQNKKIEILEQYIEQLKKIQK